VGPWRIIRPQAAESPVRLPFESVFGRDRGPVQGVQGPPEDVENPSGTGLSPVIAIGDDARNPTTCATRMTRMSIVDRFTRDKVSRLIWGVLALACLVMFVVGLQGEQRAYDRQLDATTPVSEAYAANVIAPVVHVKDGKPVLFYRETYTKIQAEIFAPDPSVARVRVWGTDGLLLFSTDNRQRTGVIQAPNDPGVQAGAQGATYRSLVTQSFTWATTGLPGKDVQLLQTYTPLRLATQIQPAGTVQVDYFVADLRAAARGDWPAVRWVFGVLFLVFLGMTLLSLRQSSRVEPVAALPAPALPAAVPAAVLADEDEDDLVAVTAIPPAATATTDGESSLREELAAAREQLVQAEEAYRFLETKLKVARSELADRPVPAESVDARVAELEEALKRSQAELMLLRATTAQPGDSPEASDGNAQEASRPSPATDLTADLAATDRSDESAGDRDSAIKLGALTEELDAVRTALEAAQADIRTAREEADAAKRSAQPAVPSSNTLSDLEARVAEAERRAEEAEQTLEEVALSPEATSLRERLARTAARKKLGSDDPHAS
jgi:hypothetical protein